MTELSTDPGRIGVAGDWHKNTLWAVFAIRQICARLEGEERKVILHAGDLGAWRGTSFIPAVNSTLNENDAEMWFIDGNHEDFPWLEKMREQSERGKSQGWIAPRIRWLTRGTRWDWHGRTWLALGGAVSVDKGLRDEGVDWFPEEEITDAQEALAIAGGHADVLLSHDAPAEVPLSLGVPPSEWLKMIPAAEAHRERLSRVCAAVTPELVFHGHYHMPGERLFSAWGKRVRAVSLDMDGTQGNWGILGTRTMEWDW